MMGDDPRLFIGDVRDFCRSLEPRSLRTVITSPPYWGLRSYGVPPLVWGGDARCDHDWSDEQRAAWANDLPGNANIGKNNASRRRARKSGRWCLSCGAWLGQLGGEPTVEAYVAHLVEVFALLYPALALDGTVWLNLGDTYAFRSARVGGREASSDGQIRRGVPESGERPKAYGSLKHKDLVGVPWRAALALQEWGWYLRSEVIWEKPNGLPESVRDRPSTSHERVFLLSKRPNYFYNAPAIAEPATGTAHSRGKGTTPKGEKTDGRGKSSWGASTTAILDTRNARTVWPINTEPFDGEHDSVFPSRLVRRCMLATSEQNDLVADIFHGTGTVAAVAHQEKRRWVGCDLDPRARTWTAQRFAAMPVAPLATTIDGG